MRRWTQIPHLAEVAIAMLIVGGIVVHAIFVPRSYRIDSKWVALVLNSLLVFGLSLTVVGREKLRLPVFWLAWGAILGVHCAAYIVLLLNVTAWPLVFYVGADAVEWLVLARVASALPFHRKRNG